MTTQHSLSQRFNFLLNELKYRQLVKNQTELGRIMGLSKQAIGNVLKGRQLTLSANYTDALLSTFGFINQTWLLEGVGSPFLDEKSTVKTPNSIENENILAESERPGYKQGPYHDTEQSKLVELKRYIEGLINGKTDDDFNKKWVQEALANIRRSLTDEQDKLKELIEMKIEKQDGQIKALIERIAQLEKQIV